jgi:hypothetical protein
MFTRTLLSKQPDAHGAILDERVAADSVAASPE